MIVNDDQIAWIERHPDTVISMMNGEKLLVRESPDELVERSRHFRRSLAIARHAAPRRTQPDREGRSRVERRARGPTRAASTPRSSSARVVGIGLVLGGHGLEGGSMRSLLQGAAALIVFGGTLGAVLLSFPVRDLSQAVTSLRHLFVDDAPPPDGVVAQIGRFAVRARKDGLLSLEDDAERMADPFMQRALALAIDGTNSTTLRAMLEDEIDSREEDEEAPARVFEAAGGYAPTVGILGAVLGLIHVMENLTDPSNLGAGIAVAFVATVYGVGSANLIFLPIGSRSAPAPSATRAAARPCSKACWRSRKG